MTARRKTILSVALCFRLSQRVCKRKEKRTASSRKTRKACERKWTVWICSYGTTFDRLRHQRQRRDFPTAPMWFGFCTFHENVSLALQRTNSARRQKHTHTYNLIEVPQEARSHRIVHVRKVNYICFHMATMRIWKSTRGCVVITKAGQDTNTRTIWLKCRRKRGVTGLRPPPGGPMAPRNCISTILLNAFSKTKRQARKIQPDITAGIFENTAAHWIRRACKISYRRIFCESLVMQLMLVTWKKMNVRKGNASELTLNTAFALRQLRWLLVHWFQDCDHRLVVPWRRGTACRLFYWTRSLRQKISTENTVVYCFRYVRKYSQLYIESVVLVRYLIGDDCSKLSLCNSCRSLWEKRMHPSLYWI